MPKGIFNMGNFAWNTNTLAALLHTRGLTRYMSVEIRELLASSYIQKLLVFYLNYLEIFARENPYPYVVHRRVTL